MRQRFDLMWDLILLLIMFIVTIVAIVTIIIISFKIHYLVGILVLCAVIYYICRQLLRIL